MAPISISEPHGTDDPTELELALRTANQEVAFARSKHTLTIVAKDEDIRKLRVQILLLEDENDELHNQLTEEEEHADAMERNYGDVVARLEDSNAEIERLENELRGKTRELNNMKAELSSLQNLNTESTRVLTEKLSLNRELANLKPELEHLRSQVSSNQSLLADKLGLERQLASVQVELENEKRAAQRLQTRLQAKKGEADDARAEELRELQDAIKKERKEREKAEQAARKAEEDAEEAKKAAAAAAAAERPASRGKDEEKAKLAAKVKEAEKELGRERREREKAERAIQKSEEGWNAQKEVLDDKLNAFRTKLKSTKEKLKEAEENAKKAEAAAVAAAANSSASANQTAAAVKNGRKRSAPQADPDVTIGTPGDGFPAKRTKRSMSSAAMPGDKSTFSITPFLNRTASIAPESPIQEEDEQVAEQEDTRVNSNADPTSPVPTPSGPPKRQAKEKAVRPKPKALASAKNKPNTKVAAAKKKATTFALDSVAEEGAEENDENADPAAKEQEQRPAAKLSGKPIPKLKPNSQQLPDKPKAPRKSIADIAAFNEEAPVEKKKKRKLLGGGGGGPKTLFDEEDGAMPAKPIPGRGMFAARALGKAKGLGGIQGNKGPLMATDDGFTFSPLKKDRRAGSVAR
ncbi:hypothetical protein BDY21DRAFT_27031 [Lineolata rhizophorae]|uniref:Uncharacterized protein n=1 Tax=Lineolata rhizophorae TaxID=578093 RepID=A0A6A6P0J5_9PEZI|nr:hypothetical protein BDY21DRAFT_27031 [Lineolata rhizophorae]